MGVFKRLYWLFDRFFKELQPFVDLFARVWVAHLFLQQVLQHIHYWPSYIFVFQSYFHHTMINPVVALNLLTFLECVTPIFLVLGLGGRIPILMSFLILMYYGVINPFIWTSMGYLKLQTFYLYGIILVLLMTHGSQLFSLDRLISYIIRKRKPELIERPKGIVRAFLRFESFFERLSPTGDVIARVWMSKIFFWVGVSRIQTWSTTLFMFWYVYQMPPPFTNIPNVVAISTTLLFTLGVLLLVLGIGGRLIPFFMFKFNIVTSVMIPFLRTEDGLAALNQHILWGLVLLMMLTYGPGKYSLDAVFIKLLQKHKSKKEQ